MAVNLYEHQRAAVEKLKPGSVLVGGVGTGKSRTALAFYVEKILGVKINDKGVYDQNTGIKKPLYIITTARKRDTLEWDFECYPFGLDRPWVTIDSWNNIKKYVDVEDAFFIFDEQRLVGYGAWVKSFLKIAKNNQWILLTATPGDTWLDYMPIFVAHGFYKNKTDFVRKHVVYNRYVNFPQVDYYKNTEILEKIRDKILVKMTFKKPAIQEHEWVKVSYDETKYKKVLKDRWNVYKDEPIQNASELCYTLRKVVNTDPSRISALKDILKQHPKIIVFYNFDYELEILRTFAEQSGVAYSEWNGHKHELIPLKNKEWLYLVQYTAGAEGWNCVDTDTMVFFSQNYSFKTTIQASGRIDRMNTTFPNLYYFHLYSGAGIDGTIKQCLLKKKQFNESKFANRAF